MAVRVEKPEFNLREKISELDKPVGLKGSELISIYGIEEGLKPGDKVTVEFKYLNGDTKKIKMLSRIDTHNELEYFKHGGILQYVLRNMI